ncbi:hypothetical protein LSCM1_05771 [Leishmania martiniquensis]|uniref:Uncharacterized protein n=1 Tax=Leishmania martiniquensis TaxID=1580590 RepID=A0A836GVF8_9TRYP|nr:hypothetical protein LSCM1_05771 [Leishmania martiniquensis]
MGCKTSAVRSTEQPHDSWAASPRASFAPPPSRTGDLPKNSAPTSPRRRCWPEGDKDGDSDRYSRDEELSRRRHVRALGNDHFAPPPPLSADIVNQSSSPLAEVAFPTSDHMGNMRGRSCRSPGSVFPHAVADDSRTAVAPPRECPPESHFDRLRIPDTLQLQELTRAQAAKSGLPSRPSSYVVTVDSEDDNATFRTEIDAHEKTDSTQAAKEYQQHVQAKRNANAARTKRRQLEEFDPVRPVDSFNVTHRGLLGRCWDRRAPELIPVAFVHAVEGVRRASGEVHPGSTATSHPPEVETGRDEYLHAPSLAKSRAPQAAVCSGRRVARRSHWFSVAGVSSEAMHSSFKSSGSGSQAGASMASPYYMSSGVLSPITSRPGACGPDFPRGGHAKSLMVTAASSPVVHGEGAYTTVSDNAVQPLLSLTPEQISALPMETREEYYNEFLARNPRFMGIKDCFAFRLADGVSEDSSTKFLRKRGLQPAPGVAAMRWNRVELFQPTLSTLVRAVAMTQGIKLDASQPEQPQVSGAGTGYPSVQHSRLTPSDSASCLLRATSDDGGTIADMQLRRSCSSYVMSCMGNESLSRRGGGSLNTSFVSYSEKLPGAGDSSGSNGSNASPSPLHNHQLSKDSSGEIGLVGGATFPEDSVLSLALGIPHSRLPQLMGTPQLGGVGRSRNCSALASIPRASAPADNGPAASPDESVLVALSVSCFSVVMDPFRWQEHRYIRYPVDIDDSRKSSRHTYGEGIITDVMYGGIMVVEASSAKAVKELEALLANMTWTERRTLHGVIGDVRKHLKVFQGGRNKVRPPTPQRRVAADAEAAFGTGTQTHHDSGAQQQTAEKGHQYRIWRRIGGRPMRDAVELQEISYFFGDAEVREETVTLNQPIGPDTATAAGGAAAKPSGASGSSAASGWRYSANGNFLAADPDISPSFSRVASVWVKLPVIAAVLRTWGLHLLSNPELAQPIALFLQKYTGIAPVLQLTALGSLCNDGDTSNEGVGEDADYLFFEAGGASVPASATAAGEATHPHPAPRIPEFNRFYASKPSTPSATKDEHHGSDSGTAAQLPQGRSNGRDVSAASLSPEQMRRCDDTKLDERGAGDAGTQQQSLEKSGKGTCAELGSEHRRREAATCEAAHLADSVKGGSAAPGVESGGDGQSSSVSKTTDTDNGQRVVGRLSGTVKKSGVGATRALRRGSRLHKVGPHSPSNQGSASTRPATQCSSPPSSRRSEYRPYLSSNATIKHGSPSSSSSSSSSSSFPIPRAATKEGANGFRVHSSSWMANNVSTPCLQAGKSSEPTVQKRPGGHRGGSTCAPSPTTPGERGKNTPSASVAVTPLLTAASRLVNLPPLSALVSSEVAPIAATDAEPSAMAATVGPDSSAAAVAAGKAMGPAAEPRVSKVTFRSPRSPTERQACPLSASSSVNYTSSDISWIRTRRATVTPSTASEATATTLSAHGSTSAAAPTIPAPKRKGATATKKRRKATVLSHQAKTSVPPSGKNVSSACHSPPTSDPITNTAETVVNSAKSSCAYHATEEEEGLWHIAMLEVKAQKQELEDLRQARRDAEEAEKQREEELRSLSRILLPHTAPQELDGVLLYLQTALDAPEDMPHGRLFLHQPSWLPMLIAVWTAPSNRLRAVEIAAELTWVDIPRLGLVAGLLYHQHAAGPLKELIIRSDRLLGFPQAAAVPPNHRGSGESLEEKWSAQPRKRRLLTGRSRKKGRRKGVGRSGSAGRVSQSSSNSSLQFTTELSQRIGGFGPGCPPFFITPEEARDTLWLLLCSVAANATAPTFHMVLRGLPTGEDVSTTTTGGGRGGAIDQSKSRTTPTRLISFFAWAAARLRDEKADARLRLRAHSMTLDSFVICQGSLSASDQDASSPIPLSDSSGIGASMSYNTAYDDRQACYNGGSMRLVGDGTAGSALTLAQQACTLSRQNSSLVVMSSLAATLDGTCGEVCSPGRQECNPSNTFAGVRAITPPTRCAGATSEGLAASGVGNETARAIRAVQTHQHRAQERRAWMRNGNDIEERPFYKLLMHRCGEVEGAVNRSDHDAGVAAMRQRLLGTTPCLQHRHLFSRTHSNGAVHAEPDGLHRQKEAVSPSAAAPATTPEAPSRLRQGSPPPHHVPRRSLAHGLRTVEDEQAALQHEAAVLRERAGEIWEALEKSVKHYNHLQKEEHQKAMKRNGGIPSPSPPRQIVLDH